MDEQREAAETPEFGPGGYLPERASKRARKIVLRAPMGLQWVVGSLVVGVIVLVAGWLALRDQSPQAPFEPVPAELVAAEGGTALWAPTGADGAGGVAGVDVGDEALVVTVGARTRVFAWPGGDLPAVCPASGLLEAPDGTAWRVTGRGLRGAPSLTEHPTVVDDGVVYADPTRTLDPPSPDPDGPATACS